jgi:hypothetical protein
VSGVTHYHVLCFQDFGGSQEYATGCERKFTMAAALELARDAVEADLPNRIGGYHPDFPEETDPDALEARFRPKYGDEWTELMSSNVAPGWEAIFIMPCDQAGECDIWRDYADRYNWTPWWTPSQGIPWAVAAGLHRTGLGRPARHLQVVR